MRMRVLVLIVGACLLQASGSLWAQPFPAIGQDSTTSLGTFSMLLNPSVSGAFVGVMGYTASTNTFTSPLLYDPTTQINRSNPLTLSNSMSGSGPVGTLTGPTVSSNSTDTALTFSGNTGLNINLTYPVPTGSGATTPTTAVYIRR